MTGNKKRRGMIIQDRDEQFLRELVLMRVIDREQAKRVAGFGSTTRANHRLLLLHRAGLLRRFFFGIGGQAQKAVYTLAPKGAALVNAPYRRLRRNVGETLVADFFVTHQLRVNEVYCALLHPANPATGNHVERWLTFTDSLDTDASLIPDGYFEAEASEKIIPAFVEVDLGNESLKVWSEKIKAYLRYAVSGSFEKRFGQSQFRVLAIATSEGRMQSIRKATADVTQKIFWFTTLSQIESHGFWSAIWLRPTGTESVPLTGPPR